MSDRAEDECKIKPLVGTWAQQPTQIESLWEEIRLLKGNLRDMKEERDAARMEADAAYAGQQTLTRHGDAELRDTRADVETARRDVQRMQAERDAWQKEWYLATAELNASENARRVLEEALEQSYDGVSAAQSLLREITAERDQALAALTPASVQGTKDTEP